MAKVCNNFEMWARLVNDGLCIQISVYHLKILFVPRCEDQCHSNWTYIYTSYNLLYPHILCLSINLLMCLLFLLGLNSNEKLQWIGYDIVIQYIHSALNEKPEFSKWFRKRQEISFLHTKCIIRIFWRHFIAHTT